ncbi:NAD(P)-dependent oxidoreductase [Virgisporangium ochraceum]|uniref:Dehydrogenase n=1 Tax=Virgisporangium ochraceum TaxID=65505 RepID=A0A8J3ZU33_9ACTN|nr:NAD(P)-dependent oxidoreductase [Virgisporangium ochraceum]GIJ67520.1 dehydrogenase [Virgisporangium ochraceum]
MTDTVAVVGTGNMGAAMVARLRAHGRPVVVFNRSPDRAAAVAARTGAEVATSAREAAASAGVVLVSLADDAAVVAVYGDLVSGLRPGTVVVETSTVSPQTVRALAAPVRDAGAALLDGPVSGSVPVVERGELTVLVGGDAAALDTARPALDTFASTVLHLGPLGAGATMKLVVNGVVHALNQAVSEALVLAEKAGVDRHAAYGVFTSSAVAAPFVRYKQAAFEDPDGTPVAFRLDLVAKDLALLAELAAAHGARMDQADTNRRLVGEALAAGFADRDISAMAAFLRRSYDSA